MTKKPIDLEVARRKRDAATEAASPYAIKLQCADGRAVGDVSVHELEILRQRAVADGNKFEESLVTQLQEYAARTLEH